MDQAPDRCPVCDGSLRASPPGPTVRCLSCGHGVRPAVPRPPLPWRDGGSPPDRAAKSSLSWRDFDRAVLRLQLLRPMLPAAATVLDLDAEQGAFPAIAAASPMTVVVAALCDTPDDLVCDAVVLWSGFEWTDTPVPDLVRIRHRVRPGGVFVVGLEALAPSQSTQSSAMSPEGSGKQTCAHGVKSGQDARDGYLSCPGAARSKGSDQRERRGDSPSLGRGPAPQVFSQESIVLALQRAGFDTVLPRDLSVPSSRLPESVASVLNRLRRGAAGSPLLRGSVEWFDQATHNTRPADLVVIASRR